MVVLIDTSIVGVILKSIPENYQTIFHSVTAGECRQGVLAHVRTSKLSLNSIFMLAF